MPDTLTTITKLIQSPPGQLAAGGVLAGIVWKFFERVEAVLSDDTKLEIAVWLLAPRRAARLQFGIFRLLLEGIHDRLEKIRATEESFKATWKWWGLATCVLAVASVLWLPHSITREGRNVHGRIVRRRPWPGMPFSFQIGYRGSRGTSFNRD